MTENPIDPSAQEAYISAQLREAGYLINLLGNNEKTAGVLMQTGFQTF